MLRRKHLQCSAEEPWDGSGKQPDEEQQQGGRKPAGFSSLAWVSLSLVPCCRQGPCRDRELRAAIGAAVPRTGTARDAHGCTWRRGKTASTAPGGTCPISGLWHVQSSRSPSPMQGSELSSPSHSQLGRAGHGCDAQDCLGCGMAAKQAGIGVPLGICPAQLSMYLSGSALTQGTEGRLGPNPSCPLFRCRGSSSSRKGLLTSPQG